MDVGLTIKLSDCCWPSHGVSRVKVVVIIQQAWDLGYGFDMGVLYKTGWLVFFGSMGTAAALAYFLS